MSAATTRDAAEAVSALLAGKVPMARRTRYENGTPVASEWLKVHITKRDRFFRANGKIVSRNMAAWAIRAGVAEMDRDHLIARS